MSSLNLRKIRWAMVIVLLVTGLVSVRSVRAAKNVIIMVADGAGYNVWRAASMYQGKVGKQVYNQDGWQSFACSTFPLSRSGKPSGVDQQDSKLVYNPLKAWDSTLRNGKPGDFAGYRYLKSTYTDSAASATALCTGRKTYNGAINWSSTNQPMRGQSTPEVAKAQGKSAGVVTSVPLSDATPSGLGGAHNITRGHHAEIANEMLDGGWLDVIMGAGNPDYDHDGRALPLGAKRDHGWVGGEKTWKALKQGERDWKLVESKADFEALTTGPTPPKVLGVPQVAKTLQEKRGRDLATPKFAVCKAKSAAPLEVPFNKNVPTLATMAQAAINCLDDNPKGFYLLIEGGAVDWANHGNEGDRMIEEQIDFVKAVEAVVDWVEKNSSWDDTLLILTSDHECGLLWGPNSDKVAFDPIQDNGPGKMPGMKYLYSSHSNSLVPLYARGPGSERFAKLVRGTDPKAAAAWNISGRYVDNTDIGAVMKAEIMADGGDLRSSPDNQKPSSPKLFSHPLRSSPPSGRCCSK